LLQAVRVVAVRVLGAPAHAETEAAEGPQIQAGYNIDGVDCSAVGTAQEGRDLYRGTVLGKADVSATFTTLMEKYGPEGFTESLRFLMQAIGADVACATPSAEKEFLYTANSDLYQVEVLGNLYRDAEKMLEQVERSDREGGGRGRNQGGSQEEAEDNKEKGKNDREGKGRGKAESELCALGLMKEILRLKDTRVVDPGGIRSFLRLKGDVAPTRDVVLTKCFKDLVYRLPLKVYNDAANRQNVLNGIQVVLDETIAVEEAALAEEEEGEAP
jgi:type III secretion system TyeA family effector delivery regulator